LLYKVLSTPFDFDDKKEARKFFTDLQDKFYQKNYVETDNDKYSELTGEIEEIIVSGGGKIV
jgi:hypothetical protein